MEEKHTAEGDWRDKVSDKLKKLRKLDGECRSEKMNIIIINCNGRLQGGAKNSTLDILFAFSRATNKLCVSR